MAGRQTGSRTYGVFKAKLCEVIFAKPIYSHVLIGRNYGICGKNALFKDSVSNKPCTLTTCTTLGPLNEELPQLFRDDIKDTSAELYNECNVNTTNAIHMSQQVKMIDAAIKDMYKRFGKPIVPYLIPKVQTIEMPQRFNYSVLNDVIQNAQNQCYTLPYKPDVSRNVGTQTDYRDSETQTVPWEPPYRVHPGHNPEVLTLAHLTLDNGLPVGKREVELIRRARMRKAWESILPPMDTPENVKIRTSIISSLEIEEWAFRESEIQCVMDLRLKLMKELSERREADRKTKLQGRYKRLKKTLWKRRDKQVKDIQHNLNRELRKLYKKHHEKKQPHKRDIIALHGDPASEIYAPQMKFGEHPQRRHEVLQKRLLKENYVDSAEKEDTMPSWLPTHEELRAIKSKPKPADLCIRETRWTEEKLKQLHADLKTIRLNIKSDETVSLMKEKYKPLVQPPTPTREFMEDDAEDQSQQAAAFLQKVVRGRAIQFMMYEGRDRCRELIEELQSTHSLEEYSGKGREKEKESVVELQREQDAKLTEQERLSEVLNCLEGATISGMLDFLSKELIRLQDERRAHAFALLAERERADREAAEAGRRQLELNRRREFDEMFRQMVKVNENSVDCYLEDIIKESIEWASEQDAKEYITQLAEKIDEAATYAMENATELAEEELVADMVYNFVLPEVEKENARKRIREKQESYLRNAHAAIYDKIFELPPYDMSKSAEEIFGETDSAEGYGEMSQGKEIYGDGGTEIDVARNRAIKDVRYILDLVIATVIPTDSCEIVTSLLGDIISDVAGSDGSWTSSSCESCSDDDDAYN